MPVIVPSDADLAVVARVAGREAWSDLGAPPENHAPRTIAEELAVARFREAIPSRRRRMTAVQARLAIVAVTAIVLGACWLVSPTRTAIGLFGAAFFCLIAFRRRGRGARPVRRMGFR
jgi:hypothetical protein